MEERLPYETVVERVTDAWHSWVTAIEGIDETAMTEAGACGDWSAADLAFHIAFWDEQAGFDVQFRHDNAGSPPPPRDWQRMNDEDHARQVGRPPADGLKVMHATHDALMRVVAAHRNDENTWLIPDLVEHYNEHTTQVQEWRTAKGI